MSTEVSHACAPCMRANVKSESFSWCSDCEEVLCELCDRAHKIGKTTRSHRIIEASTPKEIPEILPDIETCPVHLGKHLEGYCTFHDAMCCRSCMVDQHKTCERIDSIDDVSKKVKSSVLFEEVSSSISALLKTYCDFKENRLQNKEVILEIIPNLKSAIGEFRTNTVVLINTLEMTLCKELDSLGETICTELETEKDKVEEMKSAISLCKDNLEFSIEYSSNRKILLLLANLKSAICEYERTTENIISRSKDFGLSLKTCDKVTEMINSLASIKVEREPCSLSFYSPHKSPLSQVAPSLTKFKRVSDVQLPEKCAISSICIKKDNTLLMCSYFAYKIIACAQNGTDCKEVKLFAQPYGIALDEHDTDEAFITLPFENFIIVITTTDLHEKRRIETASRYRGIQIVNDVIVVGGQGQVDFLTKTGACTRTITLPAISKSVRYVHVKQNGHLLCSSADGIGCFSLTDGRSVFSLVVTSEPRGIASDKCGCLYIVEKAANIIQRLSKDGKKLDTILDSESLYVPLAICFNRDCTKMYVTFENSNTIAVYRCWT